MSDLAPFLLARIAEREAEARRVAQVGSCEPAYRPTEVLAECAALRQVVELHESYGGYGNYCNECDKDDPPMSDGWPCPTLRLLALPYADRPELRKEWR